MDAGEVVRLGELLANAAAGPWTEDAHVRDPFYITSPSGIVAAALVGYAATTDEALANAALIVAAVNALPALLAQSAADRVAIEAARGALEYCQASLGDPVPIGRRHVARAIDAALALSARADPAT